MTQPAAIVSAYVNPLDVEREAIQEAFALSHRDRIAIGARVWDLWTWWTVQHPGASARQYLTWLNCEQYSGNLYAYWQAGLAVARGFDAPTLTTMALIGRGLLAGLTGAEIETHLGDGTLSDAIIQRRPDPDQQAKEKARAAVREVSDSDKLTNDEADTRGAEMLAALPLYVREAAARAVDTGQPIPDAVADTVRDMFQRLTFMDWLHDHQPCCVPGCGVTSNIEAHHLHLPAYPGREAGRRLHDAVLPLCRHHHQHARDAAHAGGQAAWSAHHWGAESAVFAVALDLYAEFLKHIHAYQREGKA